MMKVSGLPLPCPVGSRCFSCLLHVWVSNSPSSRLQGLIACLVFNVAGSLSPAFIRLLFRSCVVGLGVHLIFCLFAKRCPSCTLADARFAGRKASHSEKQRHEGIISQKGLPLWTEPLFAIMMSCLSAPRD